jgi:hypothetical protein
MANMLTGQPLRIAMFCSQASIEQATPFLGLAQGMAEEGAEVDLFCLRHGDELDFETAGGVRIHRAGPIDLRRPLRFHSRLTPKLLQLAYRRLRENPPDVVHANGAGFTSVVAASIAKTLKRPLVVGLAGEERSGLPLTRRLSCIAYDHSLGRMVVGASDRVIGEPLAVRETLDVYVDALAERELRWFLQLQAA